MDPEPNKSPGIAEAELLTSRRPSLRARRQAPSAGSAHGRWSVGRSVCLYVCVCRYACKQQRRLYHAFVYLWADTHAHTHTHKRTHAPLDVLPNNRWFMFSCRVRLLHSYVRRSVAASCTIQSDTDPSRGDHRNQRERILRKPNDGC